MQLGWRQDQRVARLVTDFAIGHSCPAASGQEQDHFPGVVAVRRSCRVGVHAAVPHFDLLRAAHGRGHAGDMVTRQAVDLILLPAKNGHGSTSQDVMTVRASDGHLLANLTSPR